MCVCVQVKSGILRGEDLKNVSRSIREQVEGMRQKHHTRQQQHKDELSIISELAEVAGELAQSTAKPTQQRQVSGGGEGGGGVTGEGGGGEGGGTGKPPPPPVTATAVLPETNGSALATTTNADKAGRSSTPANVPLTQEGARKQSEATTSPVTQDPVTLPPHTTAAAAAAATVSQAPLLTTSTLTPQPTEQAGITPSTHTTDTSTGPIQTASTSTASTAPSKNGSSNTSKSQQQLQANGKSTGGGGGGGGGSQASGGEELKKNSVAAKLRPSVAAVHTIDPSTGANIISESALVERSSELATATPSVLQQQQQQHAPSSSFEPLGGMVLKVDGGPHDSSYSSATNGGRKSKGSARPKAKQLKLKLTLVEVKREGVVKCSLATSTGQVVHFQFSVKYDRPEEIFQKFVSRALDNVHSTCRVSSVVMRSGVMEYC